MVGLDYYDPWYQTGPDWHRSVGLILAAFTVFRLALYFLPRPSPLASHSKLERIAAKLTKLVMLMLLFCLFISGYFITTANGDPIFVFDWFSLPSILERDGLEEIAGEVHEFAAWAIIYLAGLHALAALKHHIFDKDRTLRRITIG